ncbi:dipeptide/oligopeptide/nickel ABC transporter permease/ATP-binding protein [Paenibacillus agricola]|uniref:Dipeptide/oligopeptide/nickel ABC transporter permease/ATP-binding protein n=1 Tax=Paenibacillus agricola TaxID=2716264 RepID=A0ABX0JBD7_9BACL|nr:dipeptide/oligopeptide/nickel ABC transporter permease/ATP-binding protein [Paenibacillus agricola]NHN31035.1 dipeptide/oligopeptide/nickel ABC transporter permease/ATP-binding protein [Paenibacillus agricola]
MDRRMLRQLRQTLFKDPIAVFLLLFIVMVVILSIGAPWISSHDPVKVDYAQVLLPPSSEHLLGTDNYGRDVYTRLIYGGSASLTASFMAVGLIISLSLLIGVTAGYLGGGVDQILTRLMDVLLSFPTLVLAIAIAALMGPGLTGLMIAVAAVSWPSYARIFRSYVLSVKQDGYIQAARCAGTPAWKIMLTHVLGSIAGPILVLITLDIGHVILSIASLSFLGLGIRPPQPEWGAMLNEGRAYLEEAPWLFLAPGSIIFLMVLATNYLGDTVKDALEPRTLHVPLLFKKRTGITGKLAQGLRIQREMMMELAAVVLQGGNAPKPTATEPLLVIAGVDVVVAGRTKHAMPQPILQGIDLELYPSECVGLVGESGSGKSTLALAIMGLLRLPLVQTAGDLTILGESTKDWSWEDWRMVRGKRITYITQDPMDTLNPTLTIGEQIMECLVYHKRAALTSREDMKNIVLDMLKKTELIPEVYGMYPHQLSGGMRQRAVIAMAMINVPQIIIADEPTTALDVSIQATIMELLRQLQHDSGAAMIFVSHDLRLVAQVADRIAVMYQGQLIEMNDVKSIFTEPKQAYTKQLLSSIPRLTIPKNRAL